MSALTDVSRYLLQVADAGITETTKMRLREMLAKMPSCDAERLYAELCRIQIAADEGCAPALTILQVEDSQQFVKKFLSTGVLIELVADTVELSEAARGRKWRADDMDSTLAARLHRETSRWHDHYSRFMFASREANREAYERVLPALRGQEIANPQEWETLVLADASDLRKKPITFWNAIQINRCTTDEKRAICHKLMLCKTFQDGKIIARLHARIMDDIYITTHATTHRIPVVRPRRSWCQRCFRLFTRRRRHRVAITKQEDGARCDSSGPAPASLPFV